MKSRSSLVAWGALVVIVALLAGCGSKWIAGGKLHFSQSRFERALENFQKAVEEQPNNGEAHLWLGRTLAELERDEEAVGEVRKAAELDPTQAEMVDNTLISFWSQRYNSALAFAKDGAEAEGAEQQEVLGKAEERFLRAIIFCPDSVQNYSNLGKVLYQLGRMDEAMEMFGKSRQLSAGRPDLQKFLFSLFKYFGEEALLAADRESYERALALLHDAETIPADQEDLLEVHFNIATAYFRLSDLVEGGGKENALAKAAEYYLKVLEVAPEDLDALQSLAYVYSERGMHEEAIEFGQKRLDTEPWKAAPNMLMHSLYKAAGQDRMANGHILMVQILREGQRRSVGYAREEAPKYGPSADIKNVLRDRGQPEEVRTFNVGATPYTAWFYWTDGRVYIFREGTEQIRVGFAPITEEQLQAIIG
ncbi:MAG: tetratricopeptide repeat protein [Candidatus Eisenbacteria sp.]|nr:tetratricopeptide repeat protein [Candidatus Eisenbacteria bacterium]